MIKNDFHQMLYFKAQMHKIGFRLGLCPRPRWESLQRSLKRLSWIQGVLLLRKGKRKEK